MRRAALTLAAGLLTLLLGWLFVIKPFLDRPQGDLLSTPGLAGLNVRREVAVPARSTACTGGLVVPAGTASVQYLLAGRLADAPRLALTLRAPGFSTTGGAPTVAPAGPDTFLTIPLEATVPATTASTLCLRSRHGGIRLVGTDEGNSTVLATTVVGRQPQAADVSLALFGSGQGTNRTRVGNVPSRVAHATGTPAAVTWLLMAMTALLLTLGSLAVITTAVARETRA